MLAKVKLIAEPWDCGPGGYQVGGFPPGWAEWNDKYRDTVRDYWRGEAPPAALAPRLCGSPDIFNRRGRQPWASVNFITAHDGFTLNDLVTYNDKHNEANGEDNKDGHSHNRSWNHGAEGPEVDEPIRGAAQAPDEEHAGDAAAVAGHADAARRRRVRPHAAGQQQRLLPGQRDLLARLEPRRPRRAPDPLRAASSPGCASSYPILRRTRFLTGEYSEELERQGRHLDQHHRRGDARGATGRTPTRAVFGMLLDGRAQTTGIRKRGEEATLLIIFNPWQDVVKFKLPPPDGGDGWKLLADTNFPDSTEEPRFPIGHEYEVTGRSLLLFGLTTSRTSALAGLLVARGDPVPRARRADSARARDPARVPARAGGAAAWSTGAWVAYSRPSSPWSIGFSIIGGVGWIAAQQALSLAAKLPEYRANITDKIRAVRAPQEGTIGKAAEAIKELENEAAPAAAPLAVTETPPSRVRRCCGNGCAFRQAARHCARRDRLHHPHAAEPRGHARSADRPDRRADASTSRPRRSARPRSA